MQRELRDAMMSLEEASGKQEGKHEESIKH